MLLGAPRAGGWDRGRVGERLQAALAGLQELQVLREQQRELVRAALAMPAGEGEQPLRAHSKELRLEATLTALKEQLVRDGTHRHNPAAIPSLETRGEPCLITAGRTWARCRQRLRAGRAL